MKTSLKSISIKSKEISGDELNSIVSITNSISNSAFKLDASIDHVESITELLQFATDASFASGYAESSVSRRLTPRRSKEISFSKFPYAEIAFNLLKATIDKSFYGQKDFS